MATTIDSTALYFGAPASLTVGGTEVGATTSAPKVSIKAEQYAPDFQGSGGPIADAVFNRKIEATAEFDVNEITAAKLAWTMPGSSSVVGTGSVTGGGLSTTLAADVAAAATSVVLTDATGLLADAFIEIGDTGETEIVQVLSVAGAPTITLKSGLLRAHDSGDAVVEVDDAGTTVTTWRTGRVGSTVFKDVILDGLGLDGRHLTVTITDALGDGNFEAEMSDEAIVGVHVIMKGYYDGSDPTLAPFTIEVG
jgi:hypothetical protein